jgi:iron complex transport system substrate-binding protein
MHRRLAAFLQALSALTLAACGDSATGQQRAPDPGKAAGFPVTIDQKLGPVTIEHKPTRVVALDFPSADAAIALAVVPVGMYEVSYVDGGVQQWTKQALVGEQPC